MVTAKKQKAILDHEWDRETFPDPNRDTVICEVGNVSELGWKEGDEAIVAYGSYIVARKTGGRPLDDWDGIVNVMTAAPKMLKTLEQVSAFLRDKGAEFFEDHEWRWLVDDIDAVINEANGD